jgi:hypothetical protein
MSTISTKSKAASKEPGGGDCLAKTGQEYIDADLNAIALSELNASVRRTKTAQLADDIVTVLGREPGLRRIDLARRFEVSACAIFRAIERLQAERRLPSGLGRAWARRATS